MAQAQSNHEAGQPKPAAAATIKAWTSARAVTTAFR